ncbi:hypothetical protein [Polaribacter cellanae]|uniref:Uncharacterized protein n=1 Tax=Polaribacter cellanae TaxID=2818493 RepID=A0A975CRP7_9FLAO|nr:hypothetical protein [Polaribacter cellanae]QTE23540.1 hypothetical protein J3359_04455 [Polaribacter cellanae]
MKKNLTIVALSITCLTIFNLNFEKNYNKDFKLDYIKMLNSANAEEGQSSNSACFAGETTWIFGKKVPTCTVSCPKVRLKNRLEVGNCTV